MTDTNPDNRDRLSRWRLVLGGHGADGVTTAEGQTVALSAVDQLRDRALDELYGPPKRGREAWVRPVHEWPAGSAISGDISLPPWSR
ncbi:hypothetical protein ACW0JT_16270 [Arthrobacter sp. SA17]